jgi:SPP1 gp7 family putative phage head morphogenesis protein
MPRRAPLAVAFDLPFEEAIASARARKVVLPEDYARLPADKRAQAYTVGGLAALDQVQAVMDELTRQLEQGGSFGDFQRWARTAQLGLPPHTLETVYRNGIQQSYNAGHWRRFERDADTRPYLMYDAINDSRTRPAHRALDGVIRPVGDAFWGTHSPALGHRCRCRLVSLSREQAQARGGVTQNPPAEGVADAGWGRKPVDGFAGLRSAIDQRLGRCDLGSAGFAPRRGMASPIWCHEGPARDLLLMQQTWAQRGGAMPVPRTLVLPPLSFVSAPHSFNQFMRALGADGDVVRHALPSGDTVVVSDDLFRDLAGEWKITKRGRDQWLLYLAELILRPQEIWRLVLGGSEELYLLGRFQRGRQRIDALAVFERKGQDARWVGKTAFTADGDRYLVERREDLMKKATLRWLEAERDEGRR